MAFTGGDRCRIVAMGVLAVALAGMFGCGHSYNRPKARRLISDHQLLDSSGDNSPEQVRLRFAVPFELIHTPIWSNILLHEFQYVIRPIHTNKTS